MRLLSLVIEHPKVIEQEWSNSSGFVWIPYHRHMVAYKAGKSFLSPRRMWLHPEQSTQPEPKSGTEETRREHNENAFCFKQQNWAVSLIWTSPFVPSMMYAPQIPQASWCPTSSFYALPPTWEPGLRPRKSDSDRESESLKRDWENPVLKNLWPEKKMMFCLLPWHHKQFFSKLIPTAEIFLFSMEIKNELIFPVQPCNQVNMVLLLLVTGFALS